MLPGAGDGSGHAQPQPWTKPTSGWPRSSPATPTGWPSSPKPGTTRPAQARQRCRPKCRASRTCCSSRCGRS
jgi:hypothetical protein